MTLTLTRTLTLTNPLLSGKDVEAVQHLLTVKGFPVAADGWFGPETGGQCVEAKKRLRYVKSKQTPTCGQDLVNALEAHAVFPPLPPPPPAAARSRYVAELRKALANRGQWDYRQIRPIPHPGHTGRIVTDCSGGVTYCAELAKLPDPNGKIGGREYSGLGYTGTLLDHCSQITRASLKPGDLVVFGRYPGHHVVAVLETGPDPVCFSHGKQGDPREVPLSTEIAYQPPGVAYLRWLP